MNSPFNTGEVKPGFDPIVGQNKGQPRSMTGHDAENLSKELSIPQQFIIAQGRVLLTFVDHSQKDCGNHY